MSSDTKEPGLAIVPGPVVLRAAGTLGHVVGNVLELGEIPPRSVVVLVFRLEPHGGDFSLPENSGHLATLL